MKTLVTVILLLLTASTASGSPFYRETFKLCDALETSSKDAMGLTGWKAFKSDSAVGKVGFLKINVPGSSNHLVAYNSSPVGPENGAAFWSKSVSGLTVFTDEFSFDVASLVLVQYEQRLSGYDRAKKVTDGTKIALLIGNTWYISDQMARQDNPGNFEPVTFAPRQLTYGTSPNRSGRGPDQPENFGAKLPVHGMVTAFGVFLPNVTGRVRIDNFTLSDSQVDLRLLGEQGSAAQCDYTFIPTIQPTASGSGTSNSVPDGALCHNSATRPLGRIRATAFVRLKLLASVSGRSLTAARDRAILGLLLLNDLRLDSLVNIPVQDYYRVGTLQILNTAGTTKQTAVIRPAVKILIDEYIRLAGLLDQGKRPLLQRLDPITQRPLNSSLCTDHIQTIVRRYIKRSGLQSQIRIR